MRFTPDKKLHSREHVLAEDLSQMLGEPTRFAAYLGIAKRYYERDLRALARNVRELPDLPTDAFGKYFFACLRGLVPSAEYRAEMRQKKKKKKSSGKKKKKKKQHGKNISNRKKPA